jgi:WD40 repeat protein
VESARDRLAQRGSDLNTPPDPLRNLSFDGTRVLTVTQNDAGQLWISGGRRPVFLEWRRGVTPPLPVALSANGRRAAAVWWGEAWVWDTDSGKLLSTFKCDSSAGSNTPFSLSSDGSRLLVGGSDHTVRIYPTSRDAFLGVAKRLLGR